LELIVKNPGLECQALASPLNGGVHSYIAYGRLEDWNAGILGVKSGIWSDFIF